MAQDFTVYNNEPLSWGNAAFSVLPYDGPIQDKLDLKEISDSTKVETGLQLGPGGIPVGETRGKPTYEAKATFYRSGWNTLRRTLIAVAKAKGYYRGNKIQISRVKFDLLIQYTPEDGTEVSEKVYKACRIKSDVNSAASESVDPLTVEVDLNPLQIVDYVDGEEVVLL